MCAVAGPCLSCGQPLLNAAAGPWTLEADAAGCSAAHRLHAGRHGDWGPDTYQSLLRQSSWKTFIGFLLKPERRSARCDSTPATAMVFPNPENLLGFFVVRMEEFQRLECMKSQIII